MEPSSKPGGISLFLFLAPSSPPPRERCILAARNSSRFRSERGTRTKADTEGDGSRFIGVKSSHAGAPKQFSWNKRVVIQFISCPSPLPAIEPFKRTIHPNLRPRFEFLLDLLFSTKLANEERVCIGQWANQGEESAKNFGSDLSTALGRHRKCILNINRSKESRASRFEVRS